MVFPVNVDVYKNNGHYVVRVEDFFGYNEEVFTTEELCDVVLRAGYDSWIQGNKVETKPRPIQLRDIADLDTIERRLVNMFVTDHYDMFVDSKRAWPPHQPREDMTRLLIEDNR